MNPGKLDRRVTIQKRVASRDATGSIVETWSDESKVWAEKVTHKGRESSLSDSERSQDSQQWRIRTRVINSTDYRVFYDLKYYGIEGITEEGRGNSLLLDTIAIQSIS